MLEFREMQISDRDMVNEYLSMDPAFMSDRTFLSLFVWCDYYKIKICKTDDTLYFEGRYGEDSIMFFVPLTKGDFQKAMQQLEEYVKTQDKPYKLYKVSKAQKTYFEKEMPGKFEFVENRNSFDYIYNSEDLMNLVGKKYSSKRNHINKFLTQYEGEWIYENMNVKEHFDEIMQFQVEWCKNHGDEDCENLPETLAIKKTLTYFDELGCAGGILRVRGKIAAVTIGKKTSDKLFSVMFEKGDIFVNGCYPMINQQFAQNNFSGIPFVNREEDMGIEGLRKSKQSYYPAELTLKYIAIPVS